MLPNCRDRRGFFRQSFANYDAAWDHIVSTDECRGTPYRCTDNPTHYHVRRGRDVPGAAPAIGSKNRSQD